MAIENANSIIRSHRCIEDMPKIEYIKSHAFVTCTTIMLNNHLDGEGEIEEEEEEELNQYTQTEIRSHCMLVLPQ